MRKPSTPHHSVKPSAFDFAGDENSPPAAAAAPYGSSPRSGGSPPRASGKAVDYPPSATADRRADARPPSESCMGISLATVMNTFRGPLTSTSLPTSPLSDDEGGADDGPATPFHRIRSALQKSLSCAHKNYRPHHHIDDPHFSFESLSVDRERDRSLMQRAASWDTHDSLSLRTEGAEGGTPSATTRNVQFHYPPITSVRLRPKTEPEDAKQLFFAPEELDEIEDDRSDTRAADDVETLAVGSDAWGAVPCISSTITASDCDDRSEAVLRGDRASSHVMFDPLSPRSPRSRRSHGEKRIVRGVQIMLREKSTL